MTIYLKGALVALVVAAAVYFIYSRNEGKLPVNQSPVEFQVITKMETEGAPDFELERLDGTKVKLSNFKGKLVIVNFWASWCNPCVEEIPSMVSLVEKMKGDLVVVAVSTDEEKKDIAPFLKAFKIPPTGFEVLWDKGKTVRNAYAVSKMPESFILTPDLRLAKKIVGIEQWGADGAVLYFQKMMKDFARGK